MSTAASRIKGFSVVCSAVSSGADQRKHQSSASLTSVMGATGDRPVTQKMFPFGDVIICVLWILGIERYLTWKLPSGCMPTWAMFLAHHTPPPPPPPLVIQGHDDVIKWKYFPHYWPFVWGIHRSPVNSPHKGQWRGTLTFFFICAWMNGWVNTREAGDLRRHRAHYDVTVMSKLALRPKSFLIETFQLEHPRLKIYENIIDYL